MNIGMKVYPPFFVISVHPISKYVDLMQNLLFHSYTIDS